MRIFLLFFISVFVNGQNIWLPHDSIVLNTNDSITDISVDALGQKYFVMNQQVLHSNNEKTLVPYSHTDRLEIQSLNTSNPFYITYTNTLYELHFLDRQLNKTRDAINLLAQKPFDPNLVALVDNNWFWAFDMVQQRLVLWDYQNKKVIEETDILTPKIDEKFKEIIYKNGDLYLFSNQRILKFNRFGSMTKTYDFLDYDELKLFENRIYYLQKGKIYYKKLSEEKIFQLCITPEIQDFALTKESLFVLIGKVVYIYQLQMILTELPCT